MVMFHAVTYLLGAQLSALGRRSPSARWQTNGHPVLRMLTGTCAECLLLNCFQTSPWPGIVCQAERCVQLDKLHGDALQGFGKYPEIATCS
jgi:hypothetical protein